MTQQFESGHVGIAGQWWLVPLAGKLPPGTLSETTMLRLGQMHRECLAIVRSGAMPNDPEAFYIADCDSIARLLLSLTNDAATVSSLQLTKQDCGAIMLTAFGFIGAPQ